MFQLFLYFKPFYFHLEGEKKIKKNQLTTKEILIKVIPNFHSSFLLILWECLCETKGNIGKQIKKKKEEKFTFKSVGLEVGSSGEIVRGFKLEFQLAKKLPLNRKSTESHTHTQKKKKARKVIFKYCIVSLLKNMTSNETQSAIKKRGL